MEDEKSHQLILVAEWRRDGVLPGLLLPEEAAVGHPVEDHGQGFVARIHEGSHSGLIRKEKLLRAVYSVQFHA